MTDVEKFTKGRLMMYINKYKEFQEAKETYIKEVHKKLKKHIEQAFIDDDKIVINIHGVEHTLIWFQDECITNQFKETYSKLGIDPRTIFTNIGYMENVHIKDREYIRSDDVVMIVGERKNIYFDA